MRRRHILLPLLALVTVVLLAFGVLASAQANVPWTINYYNNPSLQGGPVYSLNDQSILYDWGFGSPVSGVPADGFSMRATTSTYFYAGTYTFNVIADDGFVLYINGQTVMDVWPNPQPGKAYTAQVAMDGGWATVELDYRHLSGRAYAFLTWGFAKAPILPTVTPITPPTTPVPSVNQLENQFGNFTPCIRQNLHQAQCFQSSGAWDSPNIGSIRLEPQIVVWDDCTADRTRRMVIYVGRDAQQVKCSKSEAGWYPA